MNMSEIAEYQFAVSIYLQKCALVFYYAYWNIIQFLSIWE